MTKFEYLLISFVILIGNCMYINAQKNYSILACNFSKSQKFVGDRLRLPLPKGSVIKRGRDHDYEEYHIGFGKKKNRVWLSGIFGPNASSGEIPKDWLASSSDIVQRIWTSEEDKGVDARGKLANGNYWRYLGRYGESIKYYDVPKDAAEYFDSIIENLCYQAWQQ